MPTAVDRRWSDHRRRARGAGRRGSRLRTAEDVRQEVQTVQASSHRSSRRRSPSPRSDPGGSAVGQRVGLRPSDIRRDASTMVSGLTVGGCTRARPSSTSCCGAALRRGQVSSASSRCSVDTPSGSACGWATSLRCGLRPAGRLRRRVLAWTASRRPGPQCRGCHRGRERAPAAVGLPRVPGGGRRRVVPGPHPAVDRRGRSRRRPGGLPVGAGGYRELAGSRRPARVGSLRSGGGPAGSSSSPVASSRAGYSRPWWRRPHWRCGRPSG